MTVQECIETVFPKDENVVLVFPTDIAAKKWADWTVLNTKTQSVAMERFLAWDTFKGECIRARRKGRTSVPALMRNVFASWIVEKNRIEGGAVFKSLIKKDYADSSARFSGWIAKILPSLGVWKKYHDNAEYRAKIAERFGADGEELLAERDFETLYAEYGAFLDTFSYFDPAWEKPPFEANGKRYYIVYPEILEDYGEYRLILDDAERAGALHLIHVPEDDAAFLVDFNKNSRAELETVALYLRKKHDEGIPWTDMAVSVPDFNGYGAYIDRELWLHEIPHTMRFAQPLSSYGAGVLFRRIQECVEADFSFESMKSLLLNDDIPWRDKGAINALIVFGKQNNCLTSFGNTDIWEKSFESPKKKLPNSLTEPDGKQGASSRKPPLQRFYERLTASLRSFGNAKTCAELYAAYISFKNRFMDEAAFRPGQDAEGNETPSAFEESDRILARCVTELKTLVELEKILADDAKKTYSVVSPFSFWLSDLDETAYVSQSGSAALQVYPYRAACAAPFRLHLVVGATQDALSVSARPLGFLGDEKREIIKNLDSSFFDRDMGKLFIQLYKTSSSESALFTGAEHSFSGYGFLHGALEASGHELPPIGAEEQLFRREKDWLLGTAPNAPRTLFATSADGLRRWVARERGEDAKAQPRPNVQALLKELFFDKRRGAYKISATTLNGFFACPRKWLFKNVLRLNPIENEAELKDEFINGTVKHKILEAYFAFHKEKNIPIASGTDDTILTLALEKAFASVRDSRDWRTEISFMTGEFLFSERDALFEELRASIGQFCAVFEGWRVYGTELELESDPDAPELRGKPYYFVGIVDVVLVREENAPSGGRTKRYTIIDYKNSKASIPAVHYVGDKKPNENIDFQMPMYVYLCASNTKERIAADECGFFSIKDGDIRPATRGSFEPIVLSAARTDGAISDTTMQEFLRKADEFFERAIQNCDYGVTNLFQGYAVCAGSGSCMDFRPVCRRFFTVAGDESVRAVRAEQPCRGVAAPAAEKPSSDAAKPAFKETPAPLKAARTLDESQSAARDETRNVVVSAGAGSGKTTVLSSRFVEMVRNGTSLEKILTLTFTNKAANEMKSRIFSALKAAGMDTSDFDKAHIQTLDSYFAEIARAGAHFYGITPNFVTDTETIEKKINLEALKFLLEKRDSAEYADAIRELTGISDFQSLAHNLLAYPLIHCDNLVDPIDFSRSLSIQDEEMRARYDECAEEAVWAIGEMKRVYEEHAAEYDASTGAALATFARTMRERDVPRAAPAQDAHAFVRAVAPFLKIKKPAANWKGELYAHYKEPLNRLYDCFSFLIAFENYAQGRGTQEKAVSLLCEFQKKMHDYKRRSGLLTFNDVARLARKTLLEHDEIRRGEQGRFSKIMVDEFQDDNQLQCDVLFMIADQKKRERFDERGKYLVPAFSEIRERLSPEKLFFVGDEKQSIYAFRGADVRVFTRLKETLGLHRTLGTNYRSEPALIESFNALFGGTGGSAPALFMANGERERLRAHLGDEKARALLENEPSYERVRSGAEKAADTPPPMSVVLFNAADAEHADAKSASADDDLSAQKANAYEAEWIAREINRLVGSEYSDTAGRKRRYTYSDFCLLFRTSAALHTFERKLLAAGIPYSTEIYRGFFSDGPVNDLVSYLKLCVYPGDANAYATVLCSPFVGLSLQEMEEVVSAAKPPFDAEALSAIRSEESRARFSDAASDFAETMRLLHEKKLTAAVSHLWYGLGYRYETMWNRDVSMYAGLYDILFEIARKSEQNVQCLAQFLDEVASYKDEAAKLDGLDIPMNETDSVKMMTIHKSKGLEFKVVFVCALSNSPRAQKGDNQNVSYDETRNLMVRTAERAETKELRLSPASSYPLKAAANANVFIDEHVRENTEKECAELRRLAYVAFTRAEQRLYLVGNYKGELKGPGKNAESVDCFRPGILGERFTIDGKDCEYAPARTMYQLMLPLLDYYTTVDENGTRTAKPNAPFSFVEFTKKSLEAEGRNASPGKAGANDGQTKKEAMSRARYALSCARTVCAERVPSPYISPSSLKVSVQNEAGEETYPHIADIVKKTGGRFSYGDFGSVAHTFLEARMKGLSRAERMVPPQCLVGLDNDEELTRRVFDEAQKMADDFERTDLFKRISEAHRAHGWLKTEFDFKYAADGVSAGAIFNGRIDLVVRTGDTSYLIVDYKTDKTICPQEHAAQLGCYRNAISAMMGVDAANVECELYYLRHKKAVPWNAGQ